MEGGIASQWGIQRIEQNRTVTAQGLTRHNPKKYKDSHQILPLVIKSITECEKAFPIMGNPEHMERYLTSLAIRGVHVHNMSYHLIAMHLVKILNSGNISAIENSSTWNSRRLLLGMKFSTTALENHLALSSKSQRYEASIISLCCR